MERKSVNSQRVLWVALAFLSIQIQNSHAQNFGHIISVPAEEKSAASIKAKKSANQVEPAVEEVDDETKQILLNEGVPVETGKKEDSSAGKEGSSKYTLGINDVVEVTVTRHPEVSGRYNINSEGKIQYEFVGDLKIAGLVKDEAKNVITEKLSKYIISPEVNIKIVEYNSKVVYVIGEVAVPGKIYMRGDTITVREALVQSGLPLLSANTPKGSVITPSESGNALQKRVNIHKLLIEGDLRENLVMKPGDTLYVPPTLMAKALRVIQPVAAPIGTAAGTGRTVIAPF